MKKKIYIFAPYPLSEIFGGQIRSRQMFNFYAKIGDVSGAFLDSKYGADTNQTFTKKHNLFLIDTKIKNQTGFHGGQHLVPKFIYDDKSIWDNLIKHIKNFNPDIIVFEELWLTGLLNYPKFKEILNNKKIIYDSHNLEHEMVYKLTNNQEYRNINLELEASIAKNADLIIACSKQEFEFFSKHKKPDADVVLIENGAFLYKPKEHTTLVTDQLNHGLFFTFISSAHTPNVDSLNELPTLLPLFIPENSKLLICGSIAHQFYQKLNGMPSKKIWHSKVHYLSDLTRDEVMSIYELSRVIILPIIYGDGTNIKTAEALLSKCHIIATKKAFRGYEKFENCEGVTIVKNLDEMRIKIRDFKDWDKKYNRNLESELQWDKILEKKLTPYSNKLL